MSRSNITSLKTPAKFFAEWSSTNKCFKYYKKSEIADKKGEDVFLQLPFRFLVLDTLATIKGFSKTNSSNFWSNEVRSTKKDELIVKTKNGEVIRGLYDDIIGKKGMTGAKFSQSVYILWKDKDGTSVLANIQMIGSALGQWIEFCNKVKGDLYKQAVEVPKYIQDKNGETIYFKPEFKLIPCNADTNEQAKKLDKELQNYLNLYFNQKDETVVDIPEKLETHDEHPFPLIEDSKQEDSSDDEVTDLPF